MMSKSQEEEVCYNLDMLGHYRSPECLLHVVNDRSGSQVKPSVGSGSVRAKCDEFSHFTLLVAFVSYLDYFFSASTRDYGCSMLGMEVTEKSTRVER